MAISRLLGICTIIRTSRLRTDVTRLAVVRVDWRTAAQLKVVAPMSSMMGREKFLANLSATIGVGDRRHPRLFHGTVTIAVLYFRQVEAAAMSSPRWSRSSRWSRLLQLPRSRSSSTAPRPSPQSDASPEASAPQARTASAAPAAVSDPLSQGLEIVSEGTDPTVE
jgi:hypothetical protein